jgi:hypothetical protein
MKEILIFANESQEVKEIVQHLVQKHFKITIFTFTKFKDITAFVGMSPLQIDIVVLKIANYYNWKHELHKYDTILNLIKITDFPSQNIAVVFENFTMAFAQSVKNLGKKVIYVSNFHNEFIYGSCVLRAEEAMLSQCSEMLYIRHGFLIHSQSQFLTDIINTKILFLSDKILNSQMQITPVWDISSIISQHTNIGNTHKLSLSGEKYSLKDIISLTQLQGNHKKYIVKIPHFVLMFIAKICHFLPQRFYSSFHNHKTLSNILHIGKNKFKAESTYAYTLFAKILDKHLKNLFSSEIE